MKPEPLVPASVETHVETLEQAEPLGSRGAESGIRERETTPAPPDADATERPTSVPSYDVAAFAGGAALRPPPATRALVDSAVPLATATRPLDTLDLRLAFLYANADGSSTVREIAEMIDLPLDEVVSGYVELAALGLVSL